MPTYKCIICGITSAAVKQKQCKVGFHKFPVDPANSDIRKQWEEFAGRSDGRICSAHFGDSCFLGGRESQNKLYRLLAKSVPTIRFPEGVPQMPTNRIRRKKPRPDVTDDEALDNMVAWPFQFKPTKMDKSDKTTLALVDAVRKHPILYTNEENFKNNPVQYAAAWQEVAKTVCPTASLADVRNRWHKLRISQERFLIAGVRNRTPGIHERMGFLNAYIGHKQEAEKKTESKAANKEDSLQYAIKLVCFVRQYPALYKKGHAKDEEWENVAIQFGNGETAEDCRAEWSKLRIGYIYHLKKGTPVWPKGITPYLSFLKPHINTEPAEKSEEFAVQLIDLVRQYPPLYNGSRPAEQTTVWEQLAQHVGDEVTVPLLIAKWTKLRDKYERHLKTGKAMLPFGLEHHMGFLKRFILQPNEESPEQQVEPSPEPAITSTIVKELHCDTKDKDTAFLLSFLEDMAKMTNTQKRLFKLGAVNASLSVLDGL